MAAEVGRYASWLAAGVLLGLAASLGGCGPEVSSQGTAVKATLLFSSARNITTFVFTGIDAEQPDEALELFPEARRPVASDGAALSSPQSVRILVNEAFAGRTMLLAVSGFNDVEENPVAYGTASVRLARNQDNEVSVNVRAYVDEESGMGGADGGDAGFVVPDGGCLCATACCLPDAGCAPTVAQPVAGFFTCGAPRTYCQLTALCATTSADGCPQGRCGCGAGPPCGPGQRCTQGRCGCSSETCPEGCCSPDGQCQLGRTEAACGRAGQACVSCSGAACPFGYCGTCERTSGTCCSGLSTAMLGFPVCRNSNFGCQLCNRSSSDRCGPGGLDCHCGDAGRCLAGQACQRGVCVRN